MSISVEINRLNLSIHGVSPMVVEAASQGLGEELQRRLGMTHIGQGLASRSAMVDAGDLSISPIQIEGAASAATLRNLIADRLTGLLITHLGNTNGGGD